MHKFKKTPATSKAPRNTGKEKAFPKATSAPDLGLLATLGVVRILVVATFIFLVLEASYARAPVRSPDPPCEDYN